MKKSKQDELDAADLLERINRLHDAQQEDMLWFRDKLDKQARWNLLITMFITTITLITFGAAVVLTATLWGLISF
jgi:uncharacterized membrane protein